MTAEQVVLATGDEAWYFKHPNSSRAVMVAHGRSRNRNWMLPYIANFYEGGLSVLAFNFPAHNEEYGFCSVGLWEARTIHAALDYLEDRPDVVDVVLFGVSMGGAASVIALGERPREHVCGLVTDGIFDELMHVLFNQMKRKIAKRVPDFWVHAAALISEAVAGFSPYEVRPIAYAPYVNVTTLYLHGERDILVPTVSASRLALVTPQGRHLVYAGNHDEYGNIHVKQHTLAFARTCGVLPPHGPPATATAAPPPHPSADGGSGSPPPFR